MYRKQTRWLIITKIKHKAMSKQVRVHYGRDIKKRMDGFTNRSNVHIDQQTKITQIFWKLEWMSHKL